MRNVIAIVVVGVLIVSGFLFFSGQQAVDEVTTEAVVVDIKQRIREATATVNKERIMASDQEPGNWLAHGRTYDEQRFSPLADINDKNVAQLGLTWYFNTETRRGLEASPIVVDGVMYSTGSWSVVFANNAKQVN